MNRGLSRWGAHATISFVALTLAACGGDDAASGGTGAGAAGGTAGSSASGGSGNSGGSSTSGGSSSGGSTSGGTSSGGSAGSSSGGSSGGGSAGTSSGGSAGSSTGGSAGSASGGSSGAATGGSAGGGAGGSSGAGAGGMASGGSATGGSGGGGSGGTGTGGSATGGTGAGGSGAGGTGGATGNCAPLSECNTECVDLQTDDRYCGNCQTACDPNEVCSGGLCNVGVGELVLSEVHSQAPSFFEIHNGGANTIDLQNHQLQWSADDVFNGAFQLPSYSLGPGEYVVLVEGSGTDGTGFIYLGQSVGWLNHIALRLLNPSGLGLDFVRTATSSVPPPTGTGWTGTNSANPHFATTQSLVRNVTTADTDTEADWMLVEESSDGGFCGRADQCGNSCADLRSDKDNCGSCGLACSGAQVCIDGSCGTGFVNLWISEYRRSGRPGVELHNPTSGTVNLSNYRVDITGPTNFSYTFPNMDLPAGEFVFLYMGEGTDDGRSLYGGQSAAFGSDVAIALYDSSVSPLDFLRVGSSVTPPPSGSNWFGNNVPVPADGENQSVRRNLEKFDTDGPADWLLASPTTPGHLCFDGLTACDGDCVALDVNDAHCGGCGAPCGAGESCVDSSCSSVGTVVISEIRRNSTNDYFELYNGGPNPVDVGGWKLEWVADQVGAYTIPASTLIQPGQFVRFDEATCSPSATRVCMGTFVDWTSEISLSLKNDSDTGVDFVRTGSSVQMPPTGTAWTSANTDNPPNTDSIVRNVWIADTDTAADWAVEGSPVASAYCSTAAATVCGGQCTDLPDDPDNCGACGNACPYGNACEAGLCVEVGGIRMAVQSTWNGTHQGRPEIYLNGRWNGVDHQTNTGWWGVACRQLGFAASGTQLTSSSASCSGCGGLNSLNCNGTEALVTDCTSTYDTTGDSNSMYAITCGVN